MAPKGQQIILKLAKQLARQHTRGLESEAIGHLIGSLGILLMKDNAGLLLSRSQDFCPEEADGVVELLGFPPDPKALHFVHIF